MHVHACLRAAGVCVFPLALPALLACLSLTSTGSSETLCSRGAAKQQVSIPGSGLNMASSNLSVLLMLLAVATVTVLAQRRRPTSSSTSTSTTTDEWNYRDGSERVNMRGVSNLTQILDNWRFDILSQMRGLLQNDHQSLLPDYARIQPLSEALDDLYKEFNALKAHLGDLTEKFAAIETFIDEVKAGRANGATSAGPASAGPGAAPAQVPRQTGRRVLKKKATSSTSTSN
uniref:Si:ch211-76l23.4 n=1 Tax=Stegastes partitus TaxID=144197 RepID=A0A3B4ZFX8_9TELE